jgi:hypothetical protein
VDDTVDHSVRVLGADLRWKIRDVHELEIPHGPLTSFRAAGGQRFAVYQLTGPEAATHFDGRIDEP